MVGQRWNLGSDETSYLRALLIAAIVLVFVLGTPSVGPLLATPLAVVVARHRPFQSARAFPLLFGALQGVLLYSMFVLVEWHTPSLFEWGLLAFFYTLFALVGCAVHLALAYLVYSLVRPRRRWFPV